MTSPEQITTSERKTPGKELVVAPSSEQGGVGKLVSAIASKSCPETTCDARRPEYFTKRSPKGSRRSRGRPPRLDERLKSQVTGMVSRGMSCRAAARLAGIDHSTISRAGQRDQAFAAALVEAKRFGKMRPRLGIRGWRQAVAVLQAAGLFPEWSPEERS